MAAPIAGLTAVIGTYPLHVVRVGLAHTYTGIIHAFKTIYAKEGALHFTEA